MRFRQCSPASGFKDDFHEPRISNVPVGTISARPPDSRKLPRRIRENRRKPGNPDSSPTSPARHRPNPSLPLPPPTLTTTPASADASTDTGSRLNVGRRFCRHRQPSQRQQTLLPTLTAGSTSTNGSDDADDHLNVGRRFCRLWRLTQRRQTGVWENRGAVNRLRIDPDISVAPHKRSTSHNPVIGRQVTKLRKEKRLPIGSLVGVRSGT